MILLAPWLVLALFTGAVAQSKGHGFAVFFALALALLPAALVVALAIERRSSPYPHRHGGRGRVIQLN